MNSSPHSDPDMQMVYEALDIWAAKQTCIRGHVTIVREQIQRLEEQLEALERKLAVHEGRTAAVIHDPEWERAEGLKEKLETLRSAAEYVVDGYDIIEADDAHFENAIYKLREVLNPAKSLS